jgi:hypothetical protein
LLEGFKLLLIINDSHVEVVLFSLLFIKRSKSSLLIKRCLDFLGQLNISDDDIQELKAFVAKHIVQECLHAVSVSGALDLVHFKMGLASDQDTNSFSDGGLKLFVQLVDRNSIAEVEDIILSSLASEDNSDINGHEDVVIGRTSSHWELVDNVLLSHQELDLGPWKAPYKSARALNMVKLAMLCNNSVCSLRPLQFMELA